VPIKWDCFFWGGGIVFNERFPVGPATFDPFLALVDNSKHVSKSRHQFGSLSVAAYSCNGRFSGSA
jgi:hypothetical protein